MSILIEKKSEGKNADKEAVERRFLNLALKWNILVLQKYGSADAVIRIGSESKNAFWDAHIKMEDRF